ncbi:MAG: hypothetical protein GXP62_12640 [Oligoflexia bacterium]|nr:hypothetical protein [Oligoflexia bacterium]
MSTDAFHTDTHRTVLVCFFFIILGACGTATTPADDTGTEGDTIPFELVVEGVNDGVAYCGVKKPATWTSALCEDIQVLWTGDDGEFATLFKDNIKLDPPTIDLDGKQAILSFLTICPTMENKLYMDRVASSGDTLLLDEVLETLIDPGQEIGCPYSVVTIPDTVSFTDFEATLTKIDVDTYPWKE